MKKLLFTLFLSLLTLTMSAKIQGRFLGCTLGVSTPAQVKANAWFGIDEDEADRLDMEHESLPRMHTSRSLKRFVRFVRLVFEKAFAYILS